MCNRSDRVEKVSHVVQSGQSSGYYAGPTRSYNAEHGFTYGRAAMYGTSSTELSQQLALPNEPHYRSPWKHWWLWLLLGFLACVVVGSFISFFGFLGEASSPSNPFDAGQTAGALVGVTFIILLLIAPFPLTLWLVNREAKRRQRAYNLMVPIWEKAKRMWDKLYYCARDGGVFTPPREGGGPFVKAEDTVRYLFDYGESIRRTGLTYKDIKTL